MDQRDSQATENLQDSAYEVCSGRTDHRNTKQITVLCHGSENKYCEGIRFACGVNLLFSIHKLASFIKATMIFHKVATLNGQVIQRSYCPTRRIVPFSVPYIPHASDITITYNQE